MDDYMHTILPDKLRLDQLYVRHHTFLTDLDALLWTFVILVPRLGEKKISEGWLFGGPLTRLARRYVSWMAIDFVAAFASLGLAGFLWRLGGPLDIGLGRSIELAAALAFAFGFFNTLLGLKTVEWSRAAAGDALRLAASCGLVTLTAAALQFILLSKAYLPVGFMLSAGLLVLAAFIAVRYRLRLVSGLASRWIGLRRSGYGAGERVLVVGAGEGSQFATWLLGRTDFRHLYTIAGIADDDPAKQGMRFDGLKVLGTVADIPELVRRHNVSVIFYAINKISAADNQRILSTCNRTGLRRVMLSEVMGALYRCLASAGAGWPGPPETAPLVGSASYVLKGKQSS
jgi:FlaA1/EpsC-like NDP-sugar epimerase